MQTPRTVLRPLALAALLVCQGPLPSHAQTLPGSATVINGVVDVQRFTNGVQVTNSPGAIIHWDRFSIGAGNTVRFVQQNAGSAVLNRVTGNTATQIHGALQSNGRVFLLNPNGILFGAGARVDVAGLLASTLDIRDQDFLDGKYDFKCFNAIACEGGVDVLNPYNNRVVLEDGSQITTRTAGEGGQVWLIARDRVIAEKGSRIEAPSGQVMAATAREVSITSPALGQMRFTLTGTAGSRIDMAGDIDVPRGAAGFFADNIRLSGKVDARSEVGAVGQIVAQASTDIAVDGDARLDVSGSVLGSNAGNIFLSAEKRLSVAASARIAADATFTPGEDGGFAGQIDLTGAEVILPGKLAYSPSDLFNPVQVSARSSSVNGEQATRSGRVNVTETGTFDYALVEGDSIEGNGSAGTVTTRNIAQQITAQQSDFSFTTLTLLGIASSGDGQRMAIVLRNTRSVSSDFVQSPFSSSSSGTNTNVYEAHVLDAQGRIVSTQTLATDSTQFGTSTGAEAGLPARTYTALGLTKGGWVITNLDGENTGLLFVSASGNGEAVNIPAANVRPLLAGGVMLEQDIGGAIVRKVFSAQGQEITDSATLLAAESPDQSNPRTDILNFDVTRSLRLGGVNVPNITAFDNTLIYTDFLGQGASEALVLPGRVSVVAGVNNTAIYRLSDPLGSDPQVRVAAGYGVATPAAATTLSGIRDSVFQSTDGNNSRFVTQTQWNVLNSSQVGFVTQDVARDVSQSVTGTGTTVSNSTENRTNKLTFNTVQRTLQSTPPPLAQTSQVVALPILLASQGGRANGVVGGVGTPSFPAEPETPSTPTTPTNPSVPTIPAIPPNTSTPSEPVATLPPTQVQIPPAPYQAPTRPSAQEWKPLPGLSAIDIARLRTGDVMGPVRDTRLSEEYMNDARAIIGSTLGPDAVDRFNSGTDAVRRDILDDAAWANFLDDKVLQDATIDMSREMRGATLNALTVLQSYATLDGDALQQGLRKALSVKVAAPKPDDGSEPDRDRTALETELQILESELYQATKARMRADSQGEAERKAAEQEQQRVTGRIARALTIAAREAAGETVDDSGDVELGGTPSMAVVVTESGEIRNVSR